MKFTIPTHINRTFTDPNITVVETVDNPIAETFTPRVIIEDETGQYSHTLPPQDYINGTWTDSDVSTAIDNYFKSISQ